MRAAGRGARPNVQDFQTLAKPPLPPCYRAFTRSQALSRTIGSDVVPPKSGRAIEAPGQEAVMAEAIPRQHPAVVLRSHYTHLRALLAIAIIAVVALSVSVVILATNNNGSSPSSAPARVSAAAPAGSTRYNGGHEEGSLFAAPRLADTRYDGGPEEGTRGPGH
jgi:hypothetical protein